MKLQNRLITGTMITVTAIFAVTIALIYFVTKNDIIKNTEHEIQEALQQAASLIDTNLWSVETALSNVEAGVLLDYNLRPDSLINVVEQLVQNNPYIMGSSLAFTPDACNFDKKYSMQYAYRTPWRQILSEYIYDEPNYNYLKMSWYTGVIQSGKAFWTEPYYDNGGQGSLICTYSMPIKLNGKPIAALSADVELNSIDKIVRDTGIDDDLGDCYLLTAENKIIYHHDEKMLMEIDTQKLGRDEVRLTAHMPYTGWTIVKIMSYKELLQPMQHTLNYIIVACIIALCALFVAIRHAISRLSRAEVLKADRIESELTVAKRIQCGMLPKKESATDDAIDIGALMYAAKEIGGDLYSYLMVGNHLHFIIGDVSGKGIPAAIHMSIATRIYQAIAANDIQPATIADKINTLLSRNNPTAMFTTAIIGRIDITDGTTEICSAGHNMPLVFSASKASQYLDIDNNLPLGVIEGYKYTQSVITLDKGAHLLLYTDGVTEAENTAQTQFGAHQLQSTVELLSNGGAQEIVDAIKAAVDDYTKGQEQTDDITMLDIHYKGFADQGSVKKQKLSIDNEISQLQKVLDMCERLSIPQNLCLAIEEAVVNVINYSQATKIEIDIVCTESMIKIEISDDGIEFDPTTYDLQNIQGEYIVLGGQGIKLVKKLTDDLRYIRINNCNKLTLISNTKK